MVPSPKAILASLNFYYLITRAIAHSSALCQENKERRRTLNIFLPPMRLLVADGNLAPFALCVSPDRPRPFSLRARIGPLAKKKFFRDETLLPFSALLNRMNGKSTYWDGGGCQGGVTAGLALGL